MTKNLTNFLFWFQVIMAWVIAVPLVLNILSGKTGGLTLALYVVFMAYLILGFSLAISSYRAKPEKIRKQAAIIFFQLAVLMGVVFIIGINKIPWRPGDMVFCIVIFILSVITILYYRNLKDPICRGLLAVWCRSGPQLWFAYVMLSQGSSEGLPLISLVATCLTSLPRLIQVWLSGHKMGWDRPTKGLFIGELPSALTWGIAAIVWIILRI